MVNEVVSSQVLDLRTAQTSRPAVKPAAIDARTQAAMAAMAASSGKELPELPHAQAPEPADLSRVTEGLNRYLTNSQRNLNFHVDEASGRTVITVVNPETNEVVRQIPPEELLALARTMRDAGLLFDALA